MHQADIRAEVQKKGSNLTQIALAAGLSESACRIALLYARAPAGDRAISEFLKIPLNELWPHRYDEHGNRTKVPSSHGRNSRRKPNRRHCQNDTAA